MVCVEEVMWFFWGEGIFRRFFGLIGFFIFYRIKSGVVYVQFGIVREGIEDEYEEEYE